MWTDVRLRSVSWVEAGGWPVLGEHGRYIYCLGASASVNLVSFVSRPDPGAAKDDLLLVEAGAPQVGPLRPAALPAAVAPVSRPQAQPPPSPPRPSPTAPSPTRSRPPALPLPPPPAGLRRGGRQRRGRRQEQVLFASRYHTDLPTCLHRKRSSPLSPGITLTTSTATRETAAAAAADPSPGRGAGRPPRR